ARIDAARAAPEQLDDTIGIDHRPVTGNYIALAVDDPERRRRLHGISVVAHRLAAADRKLTAHPGARHDVFPILADDARFILRLERRRRVLLALRRERAPERHRLGIAED